MELADLSRRELKATLKANHTRPERIAEIMHAVGRRRVRLARDGVHTVIVCGDSVGVAKRAESGRKRDEPNATVGLCVAASRL